MRRNEILKIYHGIRKLGKTRGWFQASNKSMPLGWSGEKEYIRIRRESLKHVTTKTDHEVLMLLVERIYEFIPEARNSKIRLYLTSGVSTDIRHLNLLGQAFTTL